MTHTTLSRQLKALEKEGLIERKEYSQIPPKVEYSLSGIGDKFRTVLDALEKWGTEYIEFYKTNNSLSIQITSVPASYWEMRQCQTDSASYNCHSGYNLYR